MGTTKKRLQKIDKITKELGLIKTSESGIYCIYTEKESIYIDLTASADDIKSISKNIINKVKKELN